MEFVFAERVKARAEKLPPEISIFIVLLSGTALSPRWKAASDGALLSLFRVFIVQFSAARPDSRRATLAVRLLIRLLTNSITTLAVIAHGANGSGRFSRGSRLRLHAPRITRLRGCISQPADKRAAQRFVPSAFITRDI